MSGSFRNAICFALFLTGSVRTDVVVPNSATGVEGGATFSLTATGATGRTYQMSIAAAQLTGQVGLQITGLQWRLNGPGTAVWPPTVDANFASFDIFVGPGLAPGSTSATFASNFTSPPTQVRSGALTILTGSYTFGSSPNAFGPTLNFSTPYVYSGGDLTIELRMTQQTGATTQSPFDGVTAGVDSSARFAAGSTAVTATTTTANFVVTNLVTSPVPEPSSIALLGVSLASVASWRKLRQRRREPAKNP